MNTKDLRKLKVAELEKKIDELTEVLKKNHFEITNSKDTNTAKYKTARRDLAKVKTILNEQKLISDVKVK
ncbi:MAG: 50S ribosomal protein L29 [bacterium]